MAQLVRVLLILVLAASSAAAQEASIVSLLPADPARWDVAGLVGWFGGNRAGVATDWDEWSESASFAALLGYHLTPHVKLEAGVVAATWGSVFAQQAVDQTGRFAFGEHRFRSVRASGELLYQFRENVWFHPFLMAGVEAIRETREVDVQLQPVCSPAGCLPTEVIHESARANRARPVAGGGFKWYLSERMFIRSDVRATFSSRRTEGVQWRAGAGVDF